MPNDNPNDNSLDLVDLKAATPFEAQVIAGVLRDAGVPAYVEGQQLTDEFAMSQTLMNLQGVRIKVPKRDLERAREALAAARRAGERLAQEESDGPDDGGEAPPRD